MEMPADQYRLYAEFGIACEKAQVLEVEAGNVALMFVAAFVNTDRITSEEQEMFRGLVDDVNRKTLGALLKAVKRLGTFDQSIMKVVDDALERRNYLSHSFFRSHNFAILSEDGRRAMIEELKEIQARLNRAHALLCGVSSTLAAVSGRSGLSERMTENLLKQGRRVNI